MTTYCTICGAISVSDRTSACELCADSIRRLARTARVEINPNWSARRAWRAVSKALGEPTPEWCESCDQLGDVDERGLCAHCVSDRREVEQAPQGESVRLFKPAPNQIPGQLRFG